jgi:hypothetical protein
MGDEGPLKVVKASPRLIAAVLEHPIEWGTCDDYPDFSKSRAPQSMLMRNVTGTVSANLTSYLVAGCTVAARRKPKLAVATHQVWFEVHGLPNASLKNAKALRKLSQSHDVQLALTALENHRCFGHEVVVWAEDDVELCDGAAKHLDFVVEHVRRQSPYMTGKGGLPCARTSFGFNGIVFRCESLSLFAAHANELERTQALNVCFDLLLQPFSGKGFSYPHCREYAFSPCIKGEEAVEKRGILQNCGENGDGRHRG